MPLLDRRMERDEQIAGFLRDLDAKRDRTARAESGAASS